MKKINYILFVLIIFAVACKNTEPTILIDKPVDNATYFYGQEVEFSATVSDEEDATLSSENIIWTSDKDGQIGTGASFKKSDLTVNDHVITVSATDSKDLKTEKTINIKITSAEISFGTILPADNSEYIESEVITFSCTPSLNSGEQIDETKIVWTSDKDGQIGTGTSVETKLSANNHVITITYDNSTENTQTLNINVIENSVTLTYTELEYEQYYQGYEISFNCEALNFDETTVNEENIIWTSDQDGIFGSGTNFIIDNLSVNEHEITINAENEEGRTAEITFNITIIENQEPKFELLLDYMTGSFSSEAHADTTTNQYIVDVRLHMAQVWDDRNIGENVYWVYVEQAYADYLESPYRQRIYKVILEPNGIMRDEIYAIPSPATYLHDYENPENFDALATEDLIFKDGCGLTFDWNEEEEIFDGATEGHDCTASIPGVAYITSVTTLAETYLTSWDRGYASNGAWVMGPDWPYIFDKLENYTFIATK